MVTASFFRALGDPTRLEMVRRLSGGEPHTIKTVSSGLEITRQGARKHLELLANANVITLEPKGRDTAVYLDRKTLEEGRAFIAELELRWDKRLEALRQFVNGDQASSR